MRCLFSLPYEGPLESQLRCVTHSVPHTWQEFDYGGPSRPYQTGHWRRRAGGLLRGRARARSLSPPLPGQEHGPAGGGGAACTDDFRRRRRGRVVAVLVVGCAHELAARSAQRAGARWSRITCWLTCRLEGCSPRCWVRVAASDSATGSRWKAFPRPSNALKAMISIFYEDVADCKNLLRDLRGVLVFSGSFWVQRHS